MLDRRTVTQLNSLPRPRPKNERRYSPSGLAYWAVCISAGYWEAGRAAGGRGGRGVNCERERTTIEEKREGEAGERRERDGEERKRERGGGS